MERDCSSNFLFVVVVVVVVVVWNKSLRLIMICSFWEKSLKIIIPVFYEHLHSREEVLCQIC